MSEEQTIPEILRRKGEPHDSKKIFRTILKHDGFISQRQLCKETGFDKKRIKKRWERWDYDKRLDQYHEILIQKRAEDSIKKINNIDNAQIQETTTHNKIKQKCLNYLEEHINEILEKATPQQLLGLLRDLPNMSQTNNQNSRIASQGLIDSLKYVTHDENTQLDITLPELQEILRGNYQVLAEAIQKTVEHDRQKQEEEE